MICRETRAANASSEDSWAYRRTNSISSVFILTIIWPPNWKGYRESASQDRLQVTPQKPRSGASSPFVRSARMSSKKGSEGQKRKEGSSNRLVNYHSNICYTLKTSPPYQSAARPSFWRGGDVWGFIVTYVTLSASGWQSGVKAGSSTKVFVDNYEPFRNTLFSS